MKSFCLGRLPPTSFPTCTTPRRRGPTPQPHPHSQDSQYCSQHYSRPQTSRAAAGGDPPTPPPSDGNGGQEQGPQEIALVRRFPSVGYTFILAGFLKIMTSAWVATTAPNNLTRTAFGEMSRYLVVPFGIVLCIVAKRIVDSGLHESKRFMIGLMATLVIIYFGAYKLLFRVDPVAYSNQLYRPSQYPAASAREGNLNIMPGAERVYRAMQATRTPELMQDRHLERMIPEGVVGDPRHAHMDQQENWPQYPRGMPSSALFDDGVSRARGRSGEPRVAVSSARMAAEAMAGSDTAGR